jgi:hypothetical protein
LILTLDVSPETVQRVERAKSQGANMDTLLCLALEQWVNAANSADTSEPHSLASLAGKYEGEAWDELVTEIERNRQQETRANGEGE